MCGIAGLFTKTPQMAGLLGGHLAHMVVQMGDRGPDSTGVAFYGRPVAAGHTKLSLHAQTPGYDWDGALERLAAGVDVAATRRLTPAHVVVEVAAEPAQALAAVRAETPEVEIASAGRSIELFKEAIEPQRFVRELGMATMSGSHAIAHTRMATESRVTTQGSHPFWTGRDLCLVHNGSLSNHNRLRSELEREGLAFATDNDSEVAAGYLTWMLRRGATLKVALESCVGALDGFYTLAVGTAGGFAVLRDPIACKPAVMAETDDYVAIASEYRALAELPGADEATVWEPDPGVVYSWGSEG